MENNSGINCEISAELEGLSRIKIIFKAQSPKGATRRPGSTNKVPITPKENTMNLPPSPTQQPTEAPLWKKLLPIIVVALIGLAAGFFAGRLTAPRNYDIATEDTVIQKSALTELEGRIERLQSSLGELENASEQTTPSTSQEQPNEHLGSSTEQQQKQQPAQSKQQPTQQQTSAQPEPTTNQQPPKPASPVVAEPDPSQTPSSGSRRNRRATGTTNR